MTTGQSLNLPLSMPMSWRKNTPLHLKMGARAMRFSYLNGGTPVPISSAQSLNIRFDASAGIDRVIGGLLSVWPAVNAYTFEMIEQNTGWLYSQSVAVGGVLNSNFNVEAMPDEISLAWQFSASPGAHAYLAFYNVEVVK